MVLSKWSFDQFWPSKMGISSLVGGWAQPLWKMMEWVTVGMMKFPEYGKKTCSKPPTRYCWFQWFGLWDNSLETMFFYSKYTCRNQFCYHSRKLQGKNMGCDLGAEYLLRNYLESSRVHQYPIPPMYPTIYLPLITYIWIREDGSQSKCHK